MKVIILGGVAAGMSAASKLKRNLGDKVEVNVFEKGREVSYAACGIPFYVSGKVKDRDDLIARTAPEFEKSGVHVHLRREAINVDVKAKRVAIKNLDDDTTAEHGYDKLIVATGAQARRIPPMDKDRENLFTVRDVEDAVHIREQMDNPLIKRVVVVGAGFIGLEMVEACRKKGKDVLLVEFADRILPVMDPEITDALTSTLERNGVDVRVDSKVVELRGEGARADAVVVESKDGREVVPVELVLNCAGIVPNTAFIEGVDKTANSAIIVNGRMETSAPDVFAAGDCSVMTSFITGEHLYAPLGTNANKQGKIIAELLAGKAPPPFRLIGASGLKLFDVDAAKVGLSELEATRLNIDYKTNWITGNSYASYYSPEKLMVKLVYGAKSRKILGAQVMGQGVVVARANYFAIAITAGMSVDEFGYLDLIYSPPFSGVWDVTLTAAQTAK